MLRSFETFIPSIKTRTQAYHTEILLPIEVATSICILLQESHRVAQNKEGQVQNNYFE